MNIQSGINQTLSIASLLMGQTPWAEKAREGAKQEIAIKRAKEDWETKKQAAEEVLSKKGQDYTVREPAFSAAKEAGEAYYNLVPSAELHGEIAEFTKKREQQLDRAARLRERAAKRREARAAEKVEQREAQKAEMAQQEEQRIALSNRISAILEGTGIDPAGAAKDIERLRNKK